MATSTTNIEKPKSARAKRDTGLAESIGRLADAISAHANAIERLAQTSPRRSTLDELIPTLQARQIRSERVSSDTILKGLKIFFKTEVLSPADEIGTLSAGGPAYLASNYKRLNHLFKDYGLSLSEDDLADVTTVGELVGVIKWRLQHPR